MEDTSKSDPPGLYIMSFSIHGLIRGTAPELGKDADTGGQVKYVLEMAKALGSMPQVERVDLVTRRIEDSAVDETYGQREEMLSESARIIRLRCGGRKYMRKELLWPHLEEFIDRTIRYIRQQGRRPDLVHGHYADAGYVASEIAEAFDVPFIFTGHSMGRNKRAKLHDEGMTQLKMDQLYRISTRIDMEEEIIQAADLIVTSTQQEVEKQYGLYRGRSRNLFRVIPPGIDLETFYPFYDVQLDPELLSEDVKQTRFALLSRLHRFWAVPEKPFILALCRPDQRKNITGLIQAYGTDKELRTIANLAIFAGIREDISEMEENERAVLTEMLLEMDRYDLYGKLAIPKQHDFATEVPELYRLCAESGGVFVNPALVEPFGLTLIEASACGVPIVATDDGGPCDIVANCESGILVNVADSRDIARAVRELLVNRELWQKCSNNGVMGVRKHYSWRAHCEKYLDAVRDLFPDRTFVGGRDAVVPRVVDGKPSFGRRLMDVDKVLISDIDNTLVGDDISMNRLFELLRSRRDDLAWGVATGRSLELTIEAMTEYDFPTPDILICSVGTEIYYGPDFRMDKGWQKYISYQWKPESIKRLLNGLDFLNPQEAEGQRSHKISYFLEEKEGRLQRVKQILRNGKVRCQIIYSHGQFLDILPIRASKGKAVEYLRYKYEISPRHLLVAGDSGNDEAMLRSQNRALVVANHTEELNNLRRRRNVYFSPEKYAAGIIDGLHYYGFV